MEILIKSLENLNWDSVNTVYQEGLATGQATFETEAPSQTGWDNGHLPFGRLGAFSVPDGSLIGWAALSSVSRRSERLRCRGGTRGRRGSGASPGVDFGIGKKRGLDPASEHFS